MERNINELVAQMTLEEKAGLCSGADFWHLKGVERLGIPGVMVSDGPQAGPGGGPSGHQRQHQGGVLPGGMRDGGQLR